MFPRKELQKRKKKKKKKKKRKKQKEERKGKNGERRRGIFGHATKRRDSVRLTLAPLRREENFYFQKNRISIGRSRLPPNGAACIMSGR